MCYLDQCLVSFCQLYRTERPAMNPFNSSEGQKSLLLHNTFQHPVLQEFSLLWTSRSSTSGTSASFYEIPPYQFFCCCMAIRLAVPPACCMLIIVYLCSVVRSVPHPIVNVTYSNQAVICINHSQIMMFLFSFLMKP